MWWPRICDGLIISLHTPMSVSAMYKAMYKVVAYQADHLNNGEISMSVQESTNINFWWCSDIVVHS